MGGSGGVALPCLVSEFVWVSGAGSRAFQVATKLVLVGTGDTLLAQMLTAKRKTLAHIVIDCEFVFPPYICAETGGY